MTAKDGRGVLDREIRRAAAEGIDLEELSDRNFVDFYAPALLSGQLKNLPKSVCKKLRTRGFIMRTRLNRNGCFSLTDKCVNILEEARP